ncbi:MAG TPA: bifunctional (p)ppGpp synthetase/guanosine-3',5'-bis(diphosphate) 3'-pyrophosphohydrolase [Armatimonadota bacterium]|nr:bifunctional (p)ppGpp synthetase/guanosine-3',5'-bis(diphosphate) 3'-pyrophosphohydrolase [Armatimonadota bacterium]
MTSSAVKIRDQNSVRAAAPVATNSAAAAATNLAAPVAVPDLDSNPVPELEASAGNGAAPASVFEGGIAAEVFPRTTATIESLLERVAKYQPDAPLDQIRKAYAFAWAAHEGDVRDSGEAYIQHPLEVAMILARLEMDALTVQAALLHDVVEDTSHTLEEVQREFGDDTARLVDGVTKLTRADFEPRTGPEGQDVRRKEADARRQAENLRKIFLAMARDVRVMIIKLADRLHNMRTLDARVPEKQRQVARETLDIFAPLAHRLGIWEIKWELEDLCFKYLQPQAFAEVADRVAKTRARREGEVQQTIVQLQQRLREAKIEATIQGRPKHLWSIYGKMRQQALDFEAIYDLIAVRIIVNTVAECYTALGVVHDLWKPIAGLFDDYISKPKGNLYRSLHTKVIGPTAEPLEIQIRTWDMHRTAEYGIAAHWQYKEGGKPDQDFDQRIAYLRQQLFDWQNDSRDASQFLKELSSELFSHQVFVFTPRGDVIDLPAGSTPIDFAFRIHSDLGLRCVGAKVNGRIVPLNHPLQNNDIVSVMTRSNANPSMDWLNFVKTSHARNKIKAHFKRLQSDENTARGREALRAELHRQGLDQHGLLHSPEIQLLAEKLNLHSVDALLADIGYGRLSADSIVHRLREQIAPTEAAIVERPAHAPAALDLSVGGTSGILIRRSTCCLPLPGDDVVGYVSRGRGLAIHRRICPNAIAYAQNEPDRLTELQWPVQPEQLFDAPLVLITLSRIGMLNEITTIFSQTKTNILQARATEREDKMGVIEITAQVTGLEHLEQLIGRLQDMADIITIQRGPVAGAVSSRRRGSPAAARRPARARRS